MLEEKDLQAIQKILKSEVMASEERAKEYINNRFIESENLVLKEVDRVQEIIESQISQVKRTWKNLTSIIELQS